jgi:transcriptional regulator with XRE-family HTH domain
MNFSQLHEQLRSEVLRRIGRGSLTVALLARKSGLQQPHLSNFINSRRRLSLDALDRVLNALEIDLRDLLPAPTLLPLPPSMQVPLVSHDAAMHSDRIHPSQIDDQLSLPNTLLLALQLDRPARRSTRERYVAILVTQPQAQFMESLLQPGSPGFPNVIAVLDRHATRPSSLASPSRHIYAIRYQGALLLAHVTLEHNMLILRPHATSQPVHLLPLPPGADPAHFLVGRVCAVLQSL